MTTYTATLGTGTFLLTAGRALIRRVPGYLHGPDKPPKLLRPLEIVRAEEAQLANLRKGVS